MLLKARCFFFVVDEVVLAPLLPLLLLLLLLLPVAMPPLFPCGLLSFAENIASPRMRNEFEFAVGKLISDSDKLSWVPPPSATALGKLVTFDCLSPVVRLRRHHSQEVASCGDWKCLPLLPPSPPTPLKLPALFLFLPKGDLKNAGEETRRDFFAVSLLLFSVCVLPSTQVDVPTI